MLVLGTALWVFLFTVACQGVTWLLEQATYGGPPQRFDLRWVIALIGGLAIWFPLYLLEKAWKKRYQGLVRPVRLAAELAILMIPARFMKVYDSQAVSIWQIAVLGLFLARLAWIGRHNAPNFAAPGWPVLNDNSQIIPAHSTRPIPLTNEAQAGFNGSLPYRETPINSQKFPVTAAVLSGGVMLLPWVAWGSLGSIVDTLLGIGVAGLTGLVAARLILGDWDDPETQSIKSKPGPLLTLLNAATIMAVVAMALGLNGNEWLLLIIFPVLGWLAAAFSSLIQGKRSSFFEKWIPGLAIGLAASGPLLWIDPDELALIATSGPGDLIEWALSAGFGSVVLCFACILVIRLISRFSDAVPATRIAAGAVWLALIGVYLLAGQPGWNGERIFVILKEQPDVSSAQSISDYSQRRQDVYQALVGQAEASQASLRQALDQWGIGYTPYYLVNALEVDGCPLVRAWLLTRPEVDRILDSPRLRPLPEPLPAVRGSAPAPTQPLWNLEMLQADSVWNELKVTGQGIIIGQSDSGVDGQHPELAAQYLGKAGQNDGAWFDPWFHSREPVDINGHGTHTLGSILGKDVGVAPGAQWIGCVNLGRNLGNPALYLDCMQFMLAPFPQNGDPFKDGQPGRGAHILNNSWGCPDIEGCDAGTFAPAVRALTAAGIFVVVSAGNDGEAGCGSLVDPPAIYAEVFSVGAVDSSGNRAAFSSMGPVNVDGSNRSKPDLSAPGQAVLSSFPGNTYAIESGTSMAGPHVVGVVALMWSANPKLVGDIEQTRKILEETARPYSGTISDCGPANTAGHGIVNAYQAVQAAQKIK